MDSNTPQNSSANSKQIEQMWKERFGLTQTPLERFKLYLNDTDGWGHWGQDDKFTFYYKHHPEFTIQEKPIGTLQKHHRREWARGEVGYNNGDNDDEGTTTRYVFYYFGTELLKCFYCAFDDYKKTIVSPNWDRIGNGRIYYYLRDSIEYHFHCLMTQTPSDQSKNLNRINSFQSFDIPVFESEYQLEKFLTFAKNQLSIEENQLFTPQSEDEENRLFYELLDVYTEFTNQEETTP
jgi:hypothetical protein